MNRKSFFEYLRTILITITIAVVLVFVLLGVIRHQVYTEMANSDVQSHVIDYYLVNVLIEKNKYLEKQSPKDFIISLKLGMLYEVKSDYKNAELKYKQAIAKAPLNEIRPKYKLALLYLRLNRLDDVESVAVSIEDAPSKILIGNKVDLYNKLGDKYYNKADYESAQEEYQKALFYAKKINSPQFSAIQAGLASSYVYYAEEKVKAMQIDDAINSLQLALTVVNAPIIRYKLAILLMDKNQNLSLKYYDEVFNTEPSIINYDEYYTFLNNLAAQADRQGYTAKAELFRFKIKKLKKYYQSNILSVEDIAIEDAEGSIKLNKWTKKYNINFDFNLRNVSDFNINSLIVEIVFRDGDDVFGNYSKQIVDPKFPLKINSEGPTVNIKTFKYQSLNDKAPKTITAEIYVTKTEAAYKILLKKVNIVEKVKPSRKSKQALLKFAVPHF